MKIHDNNFQEQSLNTSQKMPVESFSAWMNPTGTHSGQAWYWQHQHHLQPSALEFISVDTKNTSNIQKNRQDTSSSIHTTFIPKTVHTTHQIKTISIEKGMHEKSQFHLLETSSDTTQDIDNHRYEIIHEKPEVTRITTQRKLANQIRQMQKNNHTYMIIKQRIYQKDNQVECSMNWKNSSEKSCQQQMRFLKNWFSKLGIKMRKFIINGVIQ